MSPRTEEERKRSKGRTLVDERVDRGRKRSMRQKAGGPERKKKKMHAFIKKGRNEKTKRQRTIGKRDHKFPERSREWNGATAGLKTLAGGEK